ncbi:MAG: hypothetical protein AABW46_01765 [Nanoarchaeota archaeon]
MGLFRKNKGVKELGRQPLRRPSALPVFPKYVEGSEESSFPKSISLPPFKKLPLPEFEEEPQEQEHIYQETDFEEFQPPTRRPLFKEPFQSYSMSQVSGSQPIFVKIEQYKAALKTLDDLKTKISEAEGLLIDLNQLKSQEDKELAQWQRQIAEIKNKLLDVDKNLFEV